MEKKKLNHYDVAEVIDRFEINKVFDCFTLKNWLAIGTTNKLKPSHSEVLEEARQQLSIKWDEWNEEELKMNFVSMVIFVSQLDVPKHINTYFERKLSGKVNEISISVTVDCMLASPTYSGRPKNPYFFLQEFKRSLGDNHDPEGQMLAAMILSQKLNEDNEPLYGSWIQGRFWYFTTLTNKDYCVSKPFDATEPEDLLQIVYVLRKLKELILARVTP
ncbi:hypothetical protein [Runella sp.]|jgi:hypothetical protein|uniref:hypothetical protein n=1 Tax=Runella sp. TaxID=1960881 RepID=UPI003018383A